MRAGQAKKLLWLSYGLGLSTGVATLLVNLRLAGLYRQASGKAQAFFSFTADLSFAHKYLLVLPILGALGLAIATLFAQQGPIKRYALGALTLALGDLLALQWGWQWLVVLLPK
jgi:hypothetical protein